MTIVALLTLFHGLGELFLVFSLSVSAVLLAGLIFELAGKYSLARWCNCGGFLAFGIWIAALMQLNHGDGTLFFAVTLSAVLILTAVTALAYRGT